MWLAIDIGWTKLAKTPFAWDDEKIKVVNYNSRALNALYSFVTNEEFKKISFTELLKKLGPFYRLHTKEPRQ